MNPEIMEKNEMIPETETEMVSEKDIEAAKVEAGTMETSEKKSAVTTIKEKLKGLFAPSEKEKRVAEMKKQMQQDVMQHLERTDPAKAEKLKAFRAKFGNDAYAQWDPETNDYKTPQDTSVNRQNF